jgi:hypothetical protein
MSSISITPAATEPQARPHPPRSGHCAATLPAWHPHDAIIFGALLHPASTPQPGRGHHHRALSADPAAGGYVEGADKKRWASNDAWTFCLAEGKWSAVQYAPGPVPQVRGAGAVGAAHAA